LDELQRNLRERIDDSSSWLRRHLHGILPRGGRRCDGGCNVLSRHTRSLVYLECLRRV
jgi:hypothetical protein